MASAAFTAVSEMPPNGDVPINMRPACFIFQRGTEHHVYGAQLVSPKRTLEAWLFIYTNAKDPNTIGAVQLDNIMDAFDAAFAAARDLGTGLVSLGNSA